jgi:hypothetical protein
MHSVNLEVLTVMSVNMLSWNNNTGSCVPNLLLSSSGRMKFETAIAPQYWACNSTVLPKLIVPQLENKLPTFYFNIMFTTAPHLSLSQVSWITSLPLKFHFMPKFPTRSLLFWLSNQCSPPFPVCAACPTHLTPPLIIKIALVGHKKLTLFIMSSSPLKSPLAFTPLWPHIFLSLCSSLKN